VEKLPDFISEERNQMIGQTIDRVEVLPWWSVNKIEKDYYKNK
jgi:hypothetical protein